MLWDFAQQHREKTKEFQPFTLLYLTLPEILPFCFESESHNQRKWNWTLLKISTTEFAKVVHSRCCCWWIGAQFIIGLQCASIKVETICTFTDVKHKIYSGQKNSRRWSYSLGWKTKFGVDTLLLLIKHRKKKDCVKFSRVRQNLFDLAVNVKKLKTEESKETVRAFPTMITKKNRSRNFGVITVQGLLNSLKGYNAQGIKF